MENTSDKNILHYLASNGIINLEDIQNDMENMKNKEYLSKHKYKIYYSESDKRWHSYLPDKTSKSGRKPIAKTQKENLEQAIIDFYKDLEDRDLTIGQTFYAWLNKKKDSVEIGTINRYEQDFKRFLFNIKDKKIRSIDDKGMIENLCVTTIKKMNLTHKAFAKMKLILTGMFKYGYMNNITTIDIEVTFKSMELSTKIFKKKIVKDEDMVFSFEELPVIVSFLAASEHPIDAGLLLLFKTGLRVGELVALEKKHLLQQSIIVEQMESKYIENGKYFYEVVPHAKTDAGMREVLIPEHDMWIVKKILALRGKNLWSGHSIDEDNDYIFTSAKGNRAATYVFRNRLYRVCELLGIKKKSPHKVRKTYCSMLLDAKLPEDFIIEQVGHSSIEVTKKHYCYDMDAEKKKKRQKCLQLLEKVSGL